MTDMNNMDNEIDRKNAFLNACKNGDAATIRLFIEKGYDVSVKDEKGETAYSLLAHSDMPEETKKRFLLLLELREVSQADKILNGCSDDNAVQVYYDSSDEEYYSTSIPLASAVRDGANLKTIKDLYARGGDFNKVSGMRAYHSPMTPAMELIFLKHPDERVMNFVFEHSDLSVPDYHGDTVVHMAAKYSDKHMFDTMFKYNPEVNNPNDLGETPIFMCFSESRDNDENEDLVCHKVKVLIEQGADLNVKNHDGYTPITLAAERGYYLPLKLMVEAGGDISDLVEWNVFCMDMKAQEMINSIAERIHENSGDVQEKKISSAELFKILSEKNSCR